MNKKRILATFFATALAASAGLAGTPPCGDIVKNADALLAENPLLPEILKIAYCASPMVTAARSDWDSAIEKIRVDTALPNPELMLEGMYMTEEFAGVSPNDWTVKLTQPLPLSGKLDALGELAESDARQARLKLDLAVRETSLAAREAYADLHYYRTAQKIAGEIEKISRNVTGAGETAFAENRASLYEVQKARAQGGQAAFDASYLGEQAALSAARLNSILGRAPASLFGPTSLAPAPQPAYTLEEIYALSEKNLEEVKIADEGYKKAGSMVRAARYETLPELSLGLSYGESDGIRVAGLTINLMLPVWGQKNSGILASAEADMEKMSQMKLVAGNEARAMVAEAWFSLKNSLRLTALYDSDLLGQAQAAAQSSEALFRQGRGTLGEYSEAFAAYYNFSLARERALADSQKALARLEKLAGVDISRKPEAAEGQK